jgi:hypothetical protein
MFGFYTPSKCQTRLRTSFENGLLKNNDYERENDCKDLEQCFAETLEAVRQRVVDLEAHSNPASF